MQVKPATVSEEIATLKHLFSKAMEWTVLAVMPKCLPDNGATPILKARRAYLTTELKDSPPIQSVASQVIFRQGLLRH
jgi:hypothetical protein